MTRNENQGLFDRLETEIDSVFAKIGKEGVSLYREGVPDFDGRLGDGISFATNKLAPSVGPRAEDSDAVSQPSTPLTLRIGLQTPYAQAVEHGTQPMTGRGAFVDNGDFIERITEWAIHGPLRINPETEPERLNGLIRSILETGTDAHPFWTQKNPEAARMARTYFKSALGAFMSKVGLADMVKNIPAPTITVAAPKIG